MPDLTGLDVLTSIAADGLATKVVLLAATASDRQIVRAIAAGVRGIVLKEEALTELVQCIRAVAEGGQWLPVDLVNAALERESKRRSTSQSPTQLLTMRERQVVLLVAEGLSNKEVSRRLELAEGTVKIHLHKIYQKTHVNNRLAAWRSPTEMSWLWAEEMCSRERNPSSKARCSLTPSRRPRSVASACEYHGRIEAHDPCNGSNRRQDAHHDSQHE